MEGNVSEESLLARNLSKGVILDEYVIKFFRENDLGRFASLAEFSNEVVKELENILFLLDSNETDLIEVVLKLQDELRYFQLIDFVDNFDNKDLQKLLDEISLWLKKKEKLLAEIELLSNNEKNWRNSLYQLRIMLKKGGVLKIKKEK